MSRQAMKGRKVAAPSCRWAHDDSWRRAAEYEGTVLPLSQCERTSARPCPAIVPSTRAPAMGPRWQSLLRQEFQGHRHGMPDALGTTERGAASVHALLPGTLPCSTCQPALHWLISFSASKARALPSPTCTTDWGWWACCSLAPPGMHTASLNAACEAAGTTWEVGDACPCCQDSCCEACSCA